MLGVRSLVFPPFWIEHRMANTCMSAAVYKTPVGGLRVWLTPHPALGPLLCEDWAGFLSLMPWERHKQAPSPGIQPQAIPGSLAPPSGHRSHCALCERSSQSGSAPDHTASGHDFILLFPILTSWQVESKEGTVLAVGHGTAQEE